MVTIVKRRGKNEPFDEKKVYNSVYSSCRDCDLNEAESKKIAEHTVDEVKKFFRDKKEINSTELFGFVVQNLAKHHEAVAFMYQTHREIPDV